MPHKGIMKPKYCVILYLNTMQVQTVPDALIADANPVDHCHSTADYMDKKTRVITAHDVHIWSVHAHTTAGFKAAKDANTLLAKVLTRKLYSMTGGCAFCELRDKLAYSKSSLEDYVVTALRKTRNKRPKAGTNAGHGETQKTLERAPLGDQSLVIDKNLKYGDSTISNHEVYGGSADALESEQDSEDDESLTACSDLIGRSMELREPTMSRSLEDDSEWKLSTAAAIARLESQNATMLTKLDEVVRINTSLLHYTKNLSASVGSLFAKCAGFDQASDAIRRSLANFTQMADKWGSTISANFELTTQIARHVEATNATIHERKKHSFKSFASPASQPATAGSTSSPSLGSTTPKTPSPCSNSDPVQSAACAMAASEKEPLGEHVAQVRDSSNQLSYNKRLFKDLGRNQVNKLKASTARYTPMSDDPKTILICSHPMATISVKTYVKTYVAFAEPHGLLLRLMKLIMKDQLKLDVSSFSYSGAAKDKSAIYKHPAFVGVMKQVNWQYPDYQITTAREKSITDWCRRVGQTAASDEEA